VLEELRLIIELVPSTCWFNNLRTRIPRGAWDKLRKKVYAEYNHRCALCQAENVRLNCHEIWQYDDTLYIQQLEGFMALCEMCHHCKHMGKPRCWRAQVNWISRKSLVTLCVLICVREKCMRSTQGRLGIHGKRGASMSGQPNLEHLRILCSRQERVFSMSLFLIGFITLRGK